MTNDCRNGSLSILIAACALLSPFSLHANDPLANRCMLAMADNPVYLAQMQRPEVSQSSGPQPVPQEPARPPAPPQEREIIELGVLLKALSNAETSPAAMRALAEGRPFSLDRFGILLGDVRSVMVHANAQELRGRMDKSTKLHPEARAWLDRQLSVTHSCASGRFEDRGGNLVFEQVVALVRKHRAELQPLLLFQVETASSRAGLPGTGKGGR